MSALLEDILLNRGQRVAAQHLTPVDKIFIEHRRIHQRGHLGEGGHMRWRGYSIVNRGTLGHVGNIIFFETEFTVEMHHELDGLVAGVIERDQLLELAHQAGVGVGFIELTGSMEGEIGCLGRRNHHKTGKKSNKDYTKPFPFHRLLLL